MMDVNSMDIFFAARAAARIMSSNRSGSIIQINSKSGKKALTRTQPMQQVNLPALDLLKALL